MKKIDVVFISGVVASVIAMAIMLLFIFIN